MKPDAQQTSELEGRRPHEPSHENSYVVVDGLEIGQSDLSGKTLEIRNPEDGPWNVDQDKARLTIVTADGRRESIAVLTGDLRMALAAEGFPERDTEAPPSGQSSPSTVGAPDPTPAPAAEEPQAEEDPPTPAEPAVPPPAGQEQPAQSAGEQPDPTQPYPPGEAPAA